MKDARAYMQMTLSDILKLPESEKAAILHHLDDRATEEQICERIDHTLMLIQFRKDVRSRPHRTSIAPGDIVLKEEIIRVYPTETWVLVQCLELGDDPRLVFITTHQTQKAASAHWHELFKKRLNNNDHYRIIATVKPVYDGEGLDYPDFDPSKYDL